MSRFSPIVAGSARSFPRAVVFTASRGSFSRTTSPLLRRYGSAPICTADLSEIGRPESDVSCFDENGPLIDDRRQPFQTMTIPPAKQEGKTALVGSGDAIQPGPDLPGAPSVVMHREASPEMPVSGLKMDDGQSSTFAALKEKAASDAIAEKRRNVVLNGDSIALMRCMERESVDFILTDPPYLVSYKGRDGRQVRNDDNSRWLRPSANQMHRVLKPGGFVISFYGWNRIDLFADAWKAAGFRMVGHIVFRKSYASASRFLRYEHECAYLLAKGDVTPPVRPVPDVIDMPYSGNRLHPTQKPVEALLPLVEVFCPPGGLVLDPFCGSGSSLVAARHLGRDWIGMDLDPDHAATAARRLASHHEQTAAG